MDRRYSYAPNSRGARRLREKKRKQRRRRRIIFWTVLILVAALLGFGAYKLSSSNLLSSFNPRRGAEQLATDIKNKLTTTSPSPSATPTAAPTQTPVAEPTAEPEDEVMEEDFWEGDLAVTNMGVYPSTGENNNLLDIFKNAEGEISKACYLTFDDGPNKVTTPQILDTLAKYDVKATFFVQGDRLGANADIAKRIFDEGHLIANHTYTQKYSTIYTSWDTFLDELQKTDAAISEITGQPAYKLVRMPGGSFNSGVYGSVKQEYKTKLAENGYYFIDWTAENGDDGSRSAAQIVEYVKNGYGSKPMVMLMEDSTSRKATAASLDGVLSYLKSSGYDFKRLDEICYYTMENLPSQPSASSPAENRLSFFEMRGRII